jgi:hypothetical protein
MACPFFLPRVRLDDSAWDPPPRMPLGAAWSGVCSLAPSEEIPEPRLREMCNLGYARGICARFPPDAQADAHRFSFQSNGEVVYVIEKRHAPVKHGVSTGTFADPVLEAQVTAFQASFKALDAARGQSA